MSLDILFIHPNASKKIYQSLNIIIIIIKTCNSINYQYESSIIMAVPKRKTSKSKRNMRRSHDAIQYINIIDDKDSGEPRLSHRLDLSTGMYNGKQIIKKKESKDN